MCIHISSSSDGAPICYLEGSALTPLNTKGAQSHSKLTMSLRSSSSSKDQTRKKQALLSQAAQEEISPEIPVQLSTVSAQTAERQSTSEAPTTTVAVVLAVLPLHEVPLSWLHQTEVYICGGYCFQQSKDEVAANSGRERTASGYTPGVVLQDCAQRVKAVTDTVWCAASEGEACESETTQEAPSVSSEVVPANAPTDNGTLVRDSTLRAAYSTPLRELAVVVDKCPISQDALSKEPGFAPRLLSFEDKCPRTSPSSCPRQERPTEETLQSDDSSAPLPQLLLSPVASSMSPLSDLKGDQVQIKPTDRSCEENSTVKGGGGVRLLPTSVNSRTFQGLCLLLSRRQLVAVSAPVYVHVCVCVCVCAYVSVCVVCAHGVCMCYGYCCMWVHVWMFLYIILYMYCMYCNLHCISVYKCNLMQIYCW